MRAHSFGGAPPSTALRSWTVGMWVRSMCSGVTEMLPIIDGAQVGALRRFRRTIAVAQPVVVAPAQVRAALDMPRRGRRGTPWRVTSTAPTSSGGRPGKLMFMITPAGQPTSTSRRRGQARRPPRSRSGSPARRRGTRSGPGESAMDGTPSAMPSIAPATVPDMVTSSAALWPRLTPESTRSGLRALDQLLERQHHAVGGRAGDGEAALVQLAHAQRLGERQRTRGAGLLGLRARPPRRRRESSPRDPLQRRQALGVDAVVVGEQDAQGRRSAADVGQAAACSAAAPAGWRCGRARPGSSPSAPPGCGRPPGPSRSGCGRSARPSRRRGGSGRPCAGPGSRRSSSRSRSRGTVACDGSQTSMS